MTLQLSAGNPFLLVNGVIQSAAQNVKSYAAGGSSGSNIFFAADTTGDEAATGECQVLLSGHLE